VLSKHKTYKRIKDLHSADRPQEKLIKYGPEKLSNSELLAIILRTGTKQENVVQLANKILRKFTIENLKNVTFNQLKNIHGLGNTKACQIIACLELGKRLIKDKKVNVLMSPQAVWQELKDVRKLKKEHFVVIYLDVRNQEIVRETISIGTLTSNLVHPREVFEPAVKNLAAQVIFVHNHPSGKPEPSEEDIEVTNRLVEAGKILGISIVDHVIVAEHEYYSFKENHLL
jgi:DNA repair protein RadC